MKKQLNIWYQGSNIISKVLPACFMILALNIVSNGQNSSEKSKPDDYTVAVYYFPSWHPDSINSRWHGKGWTEWELVKAARPRFEGHEQPKVPDWGYFDESDTEWSAREIDLAADNGIDCFIYDWYWYSNTGPYLQEALEKGFLRAPNRSRLKFALMWANHDWENIEPATFDNARIALTQGEVSWGLWDTISTYIVNKYFTQSNYWRIDGKPYFSIWNIVKFVNGLGGMQNALKAINLLNEKTIKAGFPGVHLNIMSNQLFDNKAKMINDITGPKTAKEMVDRLPVESVSTYDFTKHARISNLGFPSVKYEDVSRKNQEYWASFIKIYPNLLYTPNVSMGWDASPRCMQSDRFELRTYPWTPVVVGNTPEVFKKALLECKNFLDAYNPKNKIIVLNSWNEWTEGSYLLPERKYGDLYLKAVKDVFSGSNVDNK